MFIASQNCVLDFNMYGFKTQTDPVPHIYQQMTQWVRVQPLSRYPQILFTRMTWHCLKFRT